MCQKTTAVTRRTHRSEHLPSYVFHEEFETGTAKKVFDPAIVLSNTANYADRYMPDDVTRDHAKRMHYAAHRMHKAKTPTELAKWNAHYLALRDRVVLGNLKLVYRAVRRPSAFANYTDDMIGECQIVLIQAVAAFNPWLGIRFSTYAYTCLVRALSRMSQRLAADWVTRSLPIGSLPDGEPGDRLRPEPDVIGWFRIDEFLRADHPLLSEREKAILSRRYCLGDDSSDQTLEKVGEGMGLSKERVRQVQLSALDKLRKVIQPQVPTPPV